MVETAAHMVDHVLPRVPFRQWVLSVPKRVRWHMREKPEVTSGLLKVFLRAVETTVRQRSPEALADARFGAVAFVHRFGGHLNSDIHYHVLVTGGVFSAEPGGEAMFHPATELDSDDIVTVQTTMRVRRLRWLHRHGHAKLRRAVVASAGPAGATLQLSEQAREKMGLRAGPSPAVETEPRSRLNQVAARCWALLLVRIYECLPLRGPRCSQPMRIIAFVQDPPPGSR